MDDQKEVRIMELFDRGSLTRRAANICYNAGLPTVKRLLEYYLANGNFRDLYNCGISANTELTNACNELLNSPLPSKSKPDSDNFLEMMASLSTYENELLCAYFEYLTGNLSARSMGALFKLSPELSLQEIAGKVFKLNFSFSDLSHIGQWSVNELEYSFKKPLSAFIKLLNTTPKNTPSLEYVNLMLMSVFADFDGNNEIDHNGLIDNEGMIKIFNFLKILLESPNLYSEAERKMLVSMFTSDTSISAALDNNDIATQFGYSPERLRQKKTIANTRFYKTFQLLQPAFRTGYLHKYGIKTTSTLIVISDQFVKHINDLESVSFNKHFYGLAWAIILKKTHTLIGISFDKLKRGIITSKIRYRNYYFIKNVVSEQFDFESYLDDIRVRINGPRKNYYDFHYLDHLYAFAKLPINESSVEIINTCRKLLFFEFEKSVDMRGMLCLKTNKPSIQQYCYEILDREDKLMTAEQIGSLVKEADPENSYSLGSIRSVLQRDKDLFIFVGRSGIYGLKKWETEKPNIQGGTIREMVVDYLKDHDAPIHISAITAHVINYRPGTNDFSIITNLKVDELKRFRIFKGNFVGLSKHKYDPTIIDK